MLQVVYVFKDFAKFFELGGCNRFVVVLRSHNNFAILTCSTRENEIVLCRAKNNVKVVIITCDDFKEVVNAQSEKFDRE